MVLTGAHSTDAHPSTPTPGFDRLVEAACSAFWTGDYAEAERAFARVRKLDPQRPDGYVGEADMWLALRQARRAETLLARAARLPDLDRDTLAYILVRQGDAAMARRRADDATRFWRRACEVGRGEGCGRLASQRLSQWREISERGLLQ